MVRALQPRRDADDAGSRVAIARTRFVVRGDRARAPPPVPDAAVLARAIEEALAPLLDPGDPAVWVVRRIAVHARAGSHDEAAIAAAAAAGLRTAVARVLRGETVDGVMRYPDRAAWLAALLWDHAHGRAGGRWVYARFAALDAVPVGLVPRQLFAAEPTDAIPALRRLEEEGRLVAWVEAIGERGATATLAGLCDVAGGGGARAGYSVAVVRDALAAAAGPARPAASERAALIAVVRMAATSPLVAVPAIAELRAARALLGAGGGRSALVDDEGLIAHLPHRPGNAVTPARSRRRSDHADPSQRANLAVVRDEVLDTPHAGVVLLWRSVRELALDALLDELPDPARARLTLAAALAGPARAAAWADPALQWLTGCRPTRGQRPLPPPSELAARFAAHLAERAAPRTIERIVQPCGAVSIVQDRLTEDWLAIAPGAHGQTVLPDRRDPAIDAAFFGIARAPARRPWTLFARAAYADFARRLTGLDRSSAAWLWSNVLAGWGRLAPGDEAVLTMPSVPLDLVLRMTGLDGTRFAVDGARTVTIRLAGSR